MRKKIIWSTAFLLAALLVLFLFLKFQPVVFSDDIDAIARRASVQPVFYIPVMKAYFAKPLSDEEKLTKEDIEQLLKERITEAIEKDRQERQKERYQTSLTEIDVWGYESPSKTEIPLGALAPSWAKFPERILVVYKVEKKEISAWEKEYEKDVLAISELANVSPSQAQMIISRLRSEGYSISKEQIDEKSEVKLIWFSGGWDDKFPMMLDWEVMVEGEDENLIVGYDPRGILKVKPIPDKKFGQLKRVHVKAGYFDLLEEFKPKSGEITALEQKTQSLEKELEDKKKELEEKEKKEKAKRDISNATWGDVLLGEVKVEQFWWRSEASGVFLGNMKVRDKFSGYGGWYPLIHYVNGERKGAVLTNAHVAAMALDFEVYVTEDKERMWIIWPGIPYIRYTQDSDLFGSPAHILAIDGESVRSDDCDTAIMVTSEIPGYDKHRAFLGDSDKVNEGDEVIMVGNPMYMQKFLSRGIVSNKSYSALKSSFFWNWGFGKNLPQARFNWLMNSNFWFDTPIGIGGTSGSGVWATEGSEKGKVIALHNMGLTVPVAIASLKSEKGEIDPKNIGIDERVLLKNTKDKKDVFFADFPFKEAKFRFTAQELIKKDSSLEEALKASGIWVDVGGMNGAVPINYVKRYLQERGLDPDHFGWETLPSKYWEK